MHGDKELSGGGRLRGVLDQHQDAPVIACPRRHWLDMEMDQELWWNYPDLQYRIRRPGIRIEGRAHPRPVVDEARIAKTSLLTVEHFKLALKTTGDWRVANERFRKLEQLEQNLLTYV